MYGEILLADFSAATCGPLPSEFLPLKSATDCKSLFDMLTKEGAPSTATEKRTAIDLAALISVGEEFDDEDPRKTFFWIPTTEMIADHLTKKKPYHQLRELLNQGWLRLKEMVKG